MGEDFSVLFFLLLGAVLLAFVCIFVREMIKKDSNSASEEHHEMEFSKEPKNISKPTQEPTSEDELREQIKRDVLAELRRDEKKVEKRKLSTMKIVALVMFGLQFLGIAGLYISAGVDFVSAVARGIGFSVFLIVGVVLVLWDDLKGKH